MEGSPMEGSLLADTLKADILLVGILKADILLVGTLKADTQKAADIPLVGIPLAADTVWRQARDVTRRAAREAVRKVAP